MESEGLHFDLQLRNKDYFCSIYNNIPQEDYVLLEFENESYSLYEIHRGEKLYKINDTDKEKAIIWGIVLYKKLNDSVVDREIVRKIKELVSKGDEKSAIAYFREFDDNTYSIGIEERMKNFSNKRTEQYKCYL